jgi:hypothetical protein
MVTDEMPRREYPNFEPLDSMETNWGVLGQASLPVN